MVRVAPALIGEADEEDTGNPERTRAKREKRFERDETRNQRETDRAGTAVIAHGAHGPIRKKCRKKRGSRRAEKFQFSDTFNQRKVSSCDGLSHTMRTYRPADAVDSGEKTAVSGCGILGLMYP